MSDGVFSAEVVEAVMAHMNDDHLDDSLRIVRGLGSRPDATAAHMSGMDAQAIEFTAIVPVDGESDGNTEAIVRVPFAETLTERAQVRLEVVRMHTEACAALGIEPPTGEH